MSYQNRAMELGLSGRKAKLFDRKIRTKAFYRAQRRNPPQTSGGARGPGVNDNLVVTPVVAEAEVQAA